MVLPDRYRSQTAKDDNDRLYVRLKAMPVKKVKGEEWLGALKHRAFFMIIVFVFIFCLFPTKSFSQYFPAPLPVQAGELYRLTHEISSARSAHEHIQALNLLSNLHFNLPEKKPADLAIAKNFAQRALNESVKTNDFSGRSYALGMLGQIYCFDNDLKSAEHLLSMSNDTTKAKLLLQLSFFYFFRSDDDKTVDYSKSLNFAGQAKAICQKLDINELILMTHRVIAFVHTVQNKTGAEKELQQVIAEHQKAGFKRLHYLYLPIAFAYQITSNPDKAYFYSEAGLNAVKATNDSTAAGDAYFIKAMIANNRERYQDALESGKLAMRYYQQYAGLYNCSNPFLINSISISYNKMGKSAEAVVFLRNMIRRYPPHNGYDSLANFYMIGHAYRSMKRFKDAEIYFKQMYTISLRENINKLDAFRSMGQLYLDAHEYSKARPFLYQALNLPHSNLRNSTQRQLHYMLFLADSATGHYLQAIKHQTFLNNQSEVAARLEKDKIVRKMEVAYKTLEKEHEIKQKNLNIRQLERQSEAQREKLKQSQKISLLTAGALFLAIVILLLLYFMYNQNRRSRNDMVKKNNLLQKLISEKEWLLKEVHHRVKNNLHTIFCLLESQARTATTEARSALEKSQLRIYAMSLFHQKVYQSNDIEKVDFGFYIRDFLIFLQDSFDLEARNIRVIYEIEKISLPLKQAMPLALVANEALTNAAKYAFNGKSSGEISLKLEGCDQAYLLTISDNGIGIPASCFSANRSLGMELMHGLCADIGATISFEVTNGTKISINFAGEQISEAL